MDRKSQFMQLHDPTRPLILLNCWDKESAQILAEHHVAVIATSSYAVADYLGSEDGENIQFDQLIPSIQHETSPFLSVDIESGFASTLEELKEPINLLLKRKVDGINIEDRYPHMADIMDKETFCERLRFIQSVDTNNQLLVNARTDMFFTGDIAQKNQDHELLSNAVYLTQAYEQAGADCLFIPGLKNKEFIQHICEHTSLPINIMLDIEKDRLEDYLHLGVSRISYGPTIYNDWQKTGQSVHEYLTNLIALFQKKSKSYPIHLMIKG
ncbi:isocitrate lyase/PEP mutase family protein [Bacillus sp. NPDC077027]|uniref:isocitrate lyase/PEP mutase family protein n=1 Tax=Bacillus sp. NPDC077027 TaxID=3390548 RepID=UPI003D020718